LIDQNVIYLEAVPGGWNGRRSVVEVHAKLAAPDARREPLRLVYGFAHTDGGGIALTAVLESFTGAYRRTVEERVISGPALNAIVAEAEEVWRR